MKYLKEKNILKTLISCLKINAGQFPNSKFDNKEKQYFLLQKLEEEELLLQCIICLIAKAEEYGKDVSVEKVDLFGYFTDSCFQGYFFFRDQETEITDAYEKISKKDNSIKDLIIFVALLCLSVDSMELKITDGLGKIVNQALGLNKGTVDDLLSLTAYIVAMSACKEANKDHSTVREFESNKLSAVQSVIGDKIKIQYLINLLDSPILEYEDYDFIKGSLKNIIKQWVDKAYSIDIIKDFQSPKEIKFLCKKLIEEPFILKEFWEKDYKFQTPFFQLIKEDYLLGFPEDILKFSRISFHLTGNKEWDFSKNIINFFDHFDSFVTPLDPSYRKATNEQNSLVRQSNFAGDGDFDYVISSSFNIPSPDGIEVIVPEGTKARIFPHRREFYELKLNYNLWPTLFSRWNQIIYQSFGSNISENELKGCKMTIQSIACFVSQILILDPNNSQLIHVEHGGVPSKKNIMTIINCLLQSLNQIKVLEQILKEEDQSIIEDTLESISLIITAIGSLYSLPDAREHITECFRQFEKDLVDTEKPFGNTYTVYNHSGHSRLIHLFRELNELDWNYSRGQYLVTKAISSLGPAIMSDPYPSQNMIEILEVIKDLKYKINRSSIEVYLNLLETYKHALLKFKTCPTKGNFNLKSVQNDKFFETIKSFLDDSDIQKIIEEILELDTNSRNFFSSSFSTTTSGGYSSINKLLKTYQDGILSEDKLIIKSVILSALECLNIIFEMIHTITILQKDENLSKMQSSLHQFHMTNLRIVNYIQDSLMSNSSYMNDLEENKILLTITHYINFETRHSLPLDEKKKFAYSSDSLLNVSSMAIRCLTQIVRIWELSPVSRRISLAPYLNYEENGFKFSPGMISRSLNHPEEAHELLNFLICCNNSQTAFLNGFLKNEGFFQSIISTY